MQRQSSIPGDPESRAHRAEAALEALKVKSQGAAKQYEEVSIYVLAVNVLLPLLSICHAQSNN